MSLCLSSRFENFDFLKMGKYCSIISILAAFLSISSLLVYGLNLGSDFSGGGVIEFFIKNNRANIDLLRSNIAENAIFESFDINIASTDDDSAIFIVKFKPLRDFDKDIQVFKNVVGKKYGQQNIAYRKIDFLGPQVSLNLIKNSIMSILISFICIMVYLWIRFELVFGIYGIVLLVHDTLLIFGIYSIFSLEFNMTSVAAILTIIGYSINDSVVIYDRVREILFNDNFNKFSNRDIINKSITSTFRRTFYTSFTTAASVIVLLAFGGPVLRNFSIAVFCGIVIGTYSSILLAPLAICIRKR